jgi:hypothetical protein
VIISPPTTASQRTKVHSQMIDFQAMSLHSFVKLRPTPTRADREVPWMRQIFAQICGRGGHAGKDVEEAATPSSPSLFWDMRG